MDVLICSDDQYLRKMLEKITPLVNKVKNSLPYISFIFITVYMEYAINSYYVSPYIFSN